MKKTGLEIVEMIAKGKAPQKIRTKGGTTFEYNSYRYFFGDQVVNLLPALNDEFEIVEEAEFEEKNNYLESFMRVLDYANRNSIGVHIREEQVHNLLKELNMLIEEK